MSTPTDETSQDAYAVTLDLSAVETPPSQSESSTTQQMPRPAFVEGSGPHLSDETQTLLRRRLRAASLVLVIGFGLFFVRGFFLPDRSPFLLIVHLIVLGVLGGGFAVLSSGYPLSLRALRGLELAIFGAAAVSISAVLDIKLLEYTRTDNRLMTVASVKSTIIHTLTLIVVYGMFIPNNWRRATLYILPMTLMPVLTATVLRLWHPEVGAFARRVVTFEIASDNILMLILGTISTIYGTHIINTLRREAFEARQLNQYQLRERLGSGGMGEVYLAEHQLLKRPCAVKLIRPEKAGDALALRRFEREVRATARLSHPNTVEIYDYGRTDDGTFYYVMEYLPGLSLDDLVYRHGPLPAGRAIYLLRQACDALAEAHAAGLIHRDLKPANIFASQRGGHYDVVKLLDFGLVRPMTDDSDLALSGDGRISGSPQYMAPEQGSGGRDIDARCDLYAIGGVAYYLLTGQPPFLRDSSIQLLVAHARDPVSPLSEVRPDVPEDLAGIVHRLLAKTPGERFASAEELQQALAGCRDAAGWDARKAADWWHAIEQKTHAVPAAG